MRPLLECIGVTKRFPGVTALDDASFSVAEGEVHALVGENGAGKSTLIKILGGVYHPDAGRILVRGREVRIQGPREAERLGIAVIHQELSLIPVLSVGENILLRREPVSRNPLGRFWGKIRWKALFAEAAQVLADMGVPSINPRERVGRLAVGRQQLVEIARALSVDASLLVMDEPTTALSSEEVEHLFTVVRRLRSQGVAIVFVSHRLNEVFEIADRITVLRDGRYVGTWPKGETSREQVVARMVGREIGWHYERRKVPIGGTVLRVRGLSRRGVLRGVSFDLREGEVLGIAGLMGAGRTELARAIFGADRRDAGTVEVAGRPAGIRTPSAAIRRGILLVPEDRKRQGLVLNLSVRDNVSLASLANRAGQAVLAGSIRVNRGRERQVVQRLVKELDVRAAGLETPVKYLSGGNQQKVVLAKWFALKPRVFIFDEPTKGIDVGAKAEIYRIIERLAGEGVGIILISSELLEVLAVTDRVLVMREGELVAEFTTAEADPEKIMAAATMGRRAGHG